VIRDDVAKRLKNSECGGHPVECASGSKTGRLFKRDLPLSCKAETAPPDGDRPGDGRAAEIDTSSLHSPGGCHAPGYLNFTVDWPALTRALVPQIFAETGPFGRHPWPSRRRFLSSTQASTPTRPCTSATSEMPCWGIRWRGSRLVRISDGDLQLHRRHGRSSGRRGDSLPLSRSAVLQ